LNGPLIRKNAEENNEAHFKTRLVWKEAFQRVIISSGLSVHTSDVESQGRVKAFGRLHQGHEYNPLLHGEEMELSQM